MKRYSKEWWREILEKATVHAYYHNKDLEEHKRYKNISDYCLNRYAEAYHREKIEEEGAKLKIADGAAKYWADVGATYARNHILGIIESLKLKDVDVKTDYGQGVRHGYEILYDALIEKIKG